MIKFNYNCKPYFKRLFTTISNNLMDIKTFIFLDIETTGLPKMENNRTKITELCMVAVEASHIRLGVFPRVQNKLNFCFNPCKLISSESEKITGLSNYKLENQSKFTSDTVNTINSFLNHNQKPLCFVAHNGNNFDYPILQREIQKACTTLIDGIVCIDSLDTFRQLYFEEETNAAESDVTEITDCLSILVEPTDKADIEEKLVEPTDEIEDGGSTISQKVSQVKKLNETTPKKQMIEIFPAIPHPAKKIRMESSKKKLNFNVSFKLGDIYTRFTKRPPIKEHQAEGDVIMLITCAATVGDKFVDWANANAKKFCDIPAMVPGKKIGT